MTLVYRAVWTDESADSVALLDEQFALWLESKRINPTVLPRRGRWTHGARAGEVRRADSELGAIVRLSLEETDPQGRSWLTTAVALHDNVHGNAYWVDLDCADPNNAGFDLSAPRLVRLLLAAGHRPRAGSTDIADKPFIPRPETVQQLVATLADPTRRVPIAIFSPDHRLPPAENVERATAAAGTLAGIATIWMAPPQTLQQLNDALGERFKVWGGAVRLYLPRLTLDDPGDGVRHRWFPLRLFDRHPRRAGQLLGRRLLRAPIDTEPPPGWDRLRYLLARPDETELATRIATIRADRLTPERGDAAEALRVHNAELLDLLAIAEAERDEDRNDAAAEIGRLRARVAELEDDHLDDVIQLEALTEELGEVRRSFMTMAATTRGDAGDAPQEVDDTEPPASPSDAADMARKTLTSLVIPDAALRDLDRLDESEKREVWAAHSRQAFEALDAYARQVADGSFTAGGFYQWCQLTGRWPTGKISMTESSTVMGNAKLAACRHLPVDTAIDPTGRITMEAHLKIQPGGGPTIPRLYFHDDTKGHTGKIHVGFFGPHALMPNTRTN